MNIKELKDLIEQFPDDFEVVIADYDEEDSDGNMPCHTINGAEYLPTARGEQPIIALHFKSQD